MGRILSTVALVFLTVIPLLGSGCSGVSNFRTHSTEQLRRIDTDREAYRGQLYAFNGEVWDVTKSTGSTTVIMFVGGEFDPVAFNFQRRDLDIIKGDHVQVLGTVMSQTLLKLAGSNADITMLEAIAVRTPRGGQSLASGSDSYEAWASGELFAPSP